jgi:hypothetical protein
MLAATMVASICSMRSSAQAPTFASKVEAVRVDVLVTDRGQPVRGLGRSDFEILDNGVLQQVDLVSFEQIPLNVILALDMSDSVAGERLDHLRSAGTALLHSPMHGSGCFLKTLSISARWPCSSASISKYSRG